MPTFYYTLGTGARSEEQGSLTSGTIHTFNCFSFKHDHRCLDLDWRVELQTKVREDFTSMEKAPTR